MPLLQAGVTDSIGRCPMILAMIVGLIILSFIMGWLFSLMIERYFVWWGVAILMIDVGVIILGLFRIMELIGGV